MKLSAIILAFSISILTFLSCKNEKTVKVSEFGKYEGYSEEKYDNWQRTSHYITMRDSVKIAIDIIRPSEDGILEENPLPVIWNYYSYLRADMKDGKVVSLVDQSKTLQALLRNGYVVVVADRRGSGASFGKVTAPVSSAEAQDGYEITEWIADQPWCNGNVGMFGHSYSAHIQLMTAALDPPHLKAIFPSMGAFDLYQLIYPGGIYRKIIPEIVGESFNRQDFQAEFIPVDEDIDGVLADVARVIHKENISPLFLEDFPFRDSESEISKPWTQDNPMSYIQGLNESSVAIYHWAGWFDVFARDVFQYYLNLDTPQKLVVGPWAHFDSDSIVRAERYKIYKIEQLRWFDYWLKDIDNGIMEEPEIRYAIIRNPGDYIWKSSDKWPLSNISQMDYYFTAWRSGSVSSINDGGLSTKIPEDTLNYDIYKLDYSTSIGEIHLPRAPIQNNSANDMTPNDEKSLTYTTPPLETDITVIGSPVVTLIVSLNSDDANFYAYLEEINSEGKSFLITDGCLKASHRKEYDPPFDNMNLPYHRHFEEDLMPVPFDQPVEITFDLMPTANVFNKGNRIRLSITGANSGWDEMPADKPDVEMTMFCNSRMPSKITLPTVFE